jgi:hypothetical protein
MASSILSSLFSQAQVSFTNELTGTPCWTGINIADVEIPSQASTSDQPMATDSLAESTTSAQLQAADISTMKIIRPARMRITALVSDLSLIENIQSLFANTQVTLSVTSKGIIADSMSILEVNIEQTPEMLSANRVIIDLEQIVPPSTPSFVPAQSADQSSYGLSVQSAQSSSLTPAGLFSNISNNLGL